MPDSYTHDPDAFGGDDGSASDDEVGRESGASGPAGVATQTESGPSGDQGEHPDALAREFDWRGWTLVAGIVVAFFVIPGIIYLYPHVGPMFGLSFWDTYLVLPMIPAIILGLLAVWATTRP